MEKQLVRVVVGPARIIPSIFAENTPSTLFFKPESFAPIAKSMGDRKYSILCVHLGTPLEMADDQGKEAWSADVDIYGVRIGGFGHGQVCPFRFPGQYEDEETGLYYNRFRYYDPEAGGYVSQDSIGLAGGERLYGYVRDVNTWLDPYGLTGVVYLRIDNDTGEEYVGKSKSPETNKRGKTVLRKKQKKKYPKNKGYTLIELETGVPGATALSKAEDDWIRAGGGPNDLVNKRYEMNDDRYKKAGGCVGQ